MEMALVVEPFAAQYFIQHETPSSVPLRLGPPCDGQTILTRATSLTLESSQSNFPRSCLVPAQVKIRVNPIYGMRVQTVESLQGIRSTTPERSRMATGQQQILPNMKLSILLFCLALCLSTAQATDKNDHMYLYNNDQMPVKEFKVKENNYMESSNPRIVEFYSPTCGACRAFVTTYVVIAKEVIANSNVEVYAVSCDAHKDVCNEMNINGYPSVFAFPGNSTEGTILNRRKRADGLFGYTKEQIFTALEGTAIVEEARQVQDEDHIKNDPKDSNADSPHSVRSDAVVNTTPSVDGNVDGNVDADGDAANEEPSVRVRYPKLSGRHTIKRKIKGTERKKTALLGPDTHNLQDKIVKMMAAREKMGANKLKMNTIRLDGKQLTIDPKDTKQGATISMERNTPGTFEYKNRMEKLQAKLQKVRNRKAINGTAHQGKKKQGRKNIASVFNEEGLSYKKVLKRKTLMEKLPVLKHIKALSSEERQYIDASIAFVQGLKLGVYTSKDPLDESKKEALQAWLELLSVSLPPEWALHELINDLHFHFAQITTSEINLNKVLDKHMLPRHDYSPSCGGLGKDGFSCGFWTLLHIMTIGVAEHRGGYNLVEDIRVFTPMDAADTVRAYMEHFFGCIPCREHFIEKYDDCSYRRCIRLADGDTDEDEPIEAADWKELALWLWEVHNDVNIRVAIEKRNREITLGFITKDFPDKIKYIYPSLDGCFPCFNVNGLWEENFVFAFLETTYWFGDDDLEHNRLVQIEKLDGGESNHILWYMVCAGIAFVLFVRKQIVKGAPYRMNNRNMSSTLLLWRVAEAFAKPTTKERSA